MVVQLEVAVCPESSVRPARELLSAASSFSAELLTWYDLVDWFGPQPTAGELLA